MEDEEDRRKAASGKGAAFFMGTGLSSLFICYLLLVLVI
jgi:hypothetical protein